VGVSGLATVLGFSDAWDGDLIASSLKGLSLFRIRVIDGRAIYSERIPIGRRIREVHQHTNGQLVLWTETFELAFLSAGGTKRAYDYATRLIDESPLDEARKAVLRTRFDACLECHALQYGSDAGAPSLLGVWGRPVASGGFGDYSQGLRARGGVWDATSLKAFLASPDEFAPGTSMPAQHLDDPEVVDEIVRIIAAIHTIAE
jgi:cytochrome c2